MLYSRDPYLRHVHRAVGGVGLCRPTRFVCVFLHSGLRFAPVGHPMTVRVAYSVHEVKLTGALLSLTQLYSARIVVPRRMNYYNFTKSGNFARPRIGDCTLHGLHPRLRGTKVRAKCSGDHAYRVNLAAGANVTCISVTCLMSRYAGTHWPRVWAWRVGPLRVGGAADGHLLTLSVLENVAVTKVVVIGGPNS